MFSSQPALSNYCQRHSRYYDPNLGRFIEPDTAVLHESPQGLNRYSYVRNNPLKYADPTGHELRFFQFPYYVYLHTGDPAWNRALNFNVLDPSDYMMKGNQLISALEGSAVNLGLMTETDVEGINFVSMMLGNEIGLSEQMSVTATYLEAQAGLLADRFVGYVSACGLGRP